MEWRYGARTGQQWWGTPRWLEEGWARHQNFRNDETRRCNEFCLADKVNVIRVRSSGGALHSSINSNKLDWNTALQRSGRNVHKRHVWRVDGSVIHILINFILRRDNINIISWGTGRIIGAGQAHTLPVFIKMISIKHIYRQYTEKKGLNVQ